MKITNTTEQTAVGYTRKWSSDPKTEVNYTVRVVERSFESMQEAMDEDRSKREGTWTTGPENGAHLRTIGAATGWIKRAVKRTQGWSSSTFTVYADTIPGYNLSIVIRN